MNPELILQDRSFN